MDTAFASLVDPFLAALAEMNYTAVVLEGEAWLVQIRSPDGRTILDIRACDKPAIERALAATPFGPMISVVLGG